jgi:predicted NodU family carbamoyl transferase
VQQGREQAEREERAVGAIEWVVAAAADMSAMAKVICWYQGRMENC